MTDTRITRSCESSSEDGSNIMNVTVLKLDAVVKVECRLLSLDYLEDREDEGCPDSIASIFLIIY